jgi:hypothetical protein
MDVIAGLISFFFKRLGKGDPIAWGILVVLLTGFGIVSSILLIDLLQKGHKFAWGIVIALGVAAFFLVTATVIVHRKHRREDEEREKKWLQKNKKTK